MKFREYRASRVLEHLIIATVIAGEPDGRTLCRRLPRRIAVLDTITFVTLLTSARRGADSNFSPLFPLKE